MLQEPGWKIGRSTYLSLTSTTIIDVDPAISDASWLRRWASRQKVREAINPSFPEGVFERINNLYTQLPVVFARDIARRRQSFASPVSGTPTRNSATPSLLPPSGIGVKRERPDSAGYQRNESPSAPKRRDTGEGKSIAGPSTGRLSAPSMQFGNGPKQSER